MFTFKDHFQDYFKTFLLIKTKHVFQNTVFDIYDIDFRGSIRYLKQTFRQYMN